MEVLDPKGLFGKDAVISHIHSLKSIGRIPHGILFSGEQGIGKLTMARYTAMTIFCQNAGIDGQPCLSCNSCNKVLKNEHPDIVFAKGEKYTKKELTDIVRDSIIKPNDGDVRVYIFEDCEEMTAEQQNVLLKLIEEPSEFNRFIFTAENNSKILATIISRLVSIQMPLPYREDCISCLCYKGIDKEKAELLVNSFGNNIGKCLRGESDETQLLLLELAKNIVSAMADKNEYKLAVSLNNITTTDRTKLNNVLVLVSETVRDGIMLSEGCGKPSGFDKEGAQRLSNVLSLKRLVAVIDKLFEYISKSNVNVNVSLTNAKYACELFGILV